MNELNLAQAIVQSLCEAVFVVDLSKRILFMNPAAEEMTGWRMNEAAGRNCYELLCDPERKCVEYCPLDRVLSERRPMGETAGRLVRKDGAIVEVRVSISPLISGDTLIGAVVCVADNTQFAAIENALRESESRYRALVETQVDAVCRFLPDMTLTYVNEAFCLLHGKARDELIGRKVTSLVPHRYREGVKEYLASLVANPRVSTYELEMESEEGVSRWIQWTDAPVVDDRGRVVEIQSVGREFTERKKAEDALRESEHKFRSIFDNSRDAIALIRLEKDGSMGRFMEVNAATCNKLGYTREELVLMTPSDIVLPEERVRIGQISDELLTKEYVAFETEVLNKDGSSRPIEATMRLFELRGEEVILTIARDISERIKAEKALRAERDLAQSYLDVASVMIVVISPSQEVVLINKKGCDILGYRADEIIGRNWFDNFLPESTRESVREIFEKVLAGDLIAAEYYENPVLTAGGEERLIAWHNSFLRDDDGRIVATISSGEDITVRSRVEKELRESENRFRLLFHAMSEGLVLARPVLDEYGRASDLLFLEANPAFARITGLGVEAIVGRTLRDVFPEADESLIEACSEVAFSRGPVSISMASDVFGGRHRLTIFSPSPGEAAFLVMSAAC